jgi:hypothetical protein
VAPKTSPAERRSEARTLVNETATIQSLSPLFLETFEVQVIDVSSRGMAVRLGRHIAAQSEVKVRRGASLVFGEVIYCVPVLGGFRAGIKIKETIPTPLPPGV